MKHKILLLCSTLVFALTSCNPFHQLQKNTIYTAVIKEDGFKKIVSQVCFKDTTCYQIIFEHYEYFEKDIIISKMEQTYELYGDTIYLTALKSNYGTITGLTTIDYVANYGYNKSTYTHKTNFAI